MYEGQILHPDHGWMSVVRASSIARCEFVLARDYPAFFGFHGYSRVIEVSA